MRPLVIVSLLLAGLLLAPTASAKELAGATVCGAEECRTLGPDELGGFMPEGDAAANPAPAPFLRVTLRFRGEHEDEIASWESVVIPSIGLLSGDGWIRLWPEARARLQVFAEGLEPWPASELATAVEQVGGAPVDTTTPPPAPVEAPPPIDRTSGTGVVLAGLAVIVLMGLLAAIATVRGLPSPHRARDLGT